MLFGCTRKENMEHLIFKSGLAYTPDSETPYSGKVFVLQDKVRGLAQSKGAFKDGLKDGEWTYYWAHDNDRIREIRNFKKGEIEGEVITYFKNGNKENLENYRDKKKDGQFITYYENGKEEKIDNYANGKIVGRKSFYEDGNPFLESKYLGISDNKEKWNLIYYYPDGKKLSEFIDFTSNLYQSSQVDPATLKIFFRNGNSRYKLNKLSDYSVNIISYYPNGHKFYECTCTYDTHEYLLSSSEINSALRSIKEDNFIYGDKKL